MNAPIGLFDSGLGGLTVARRIQERMPHERIVFVADQAHVPYGGRDLSEVCGFAVNISAALARYGCRALVMACNISSAVALSAAQAEHPEIPILGVILPGAQAAASRTKTGRIGVLATEGTVRSGAYTRALHTLELDLKVTEVACPAFVPLIEAGRESSPAAEQAAADYLAPLLHASVDTVILGCTHYPFLLPVLQRLQPELDYVDPAEQAVLTLEATLLPLPPPSDRAPDLLLTTGDPDLFRAQLCRFLPSASGRAVIARAKWEAGRLDLL